MTYRPLHFFGIPGLFLCLMSVLVCCRYLVFYFSGEGAGHIQSLFLASIMMGAGLSAIVVGLIGDLISINRKLLEKINLRVCEIQEDVRSLQSESSIPKSE